MFIKDTIEGAITTYNERYDQIPKKYLQPQKGKYVKEFVLHLGKEISEDELEKFKI